jgi:AcrR family transcriptional regulator
VPSETRTAERRPRISREFIEAHRRRRFAEGAAEILHEFGRPGVTTSNILRVAGGARNSFYEVFRNVDDCIGHGIGLAEEELFAGVGEDAFEGEWGTAVASSIAGFYGRVADRPLAAELLLVHAAASPTETGRAAFASAGARFAPLIDRGRDDTAGSPPPLLAECLSWSIVWLAERHVRCGTTEELPAQATPMTSLVVGYYR